MYHAYNIYTNIFVYLYDYYNISNSFHASTVAIQNTPNWARFVNGPLLVYSMTVVPMLIDYLYKKYYRKKYSPLYLRITPAIFAFAFATFLRCRMDECDWNGLSEDYYYMLFYYIAVPLLAIIMGVTLKLFSDYFTNNKCIIILSIIILFIALNMFCIYSRELSFVYGTIGVLFGIMLIQIFIVKWWWRLILV